MWSQYDNVKPGEMDQIPASRYSFDSFLDTALKVVLFETEGNSRFPGEAGLSWESSFVEADRAAFIAHFEAFDMLLEARITARETNVDTKRTYSLERPGYKASETCYNNLEIFIFEGWGGRGRKILCSELVKIECLMSRTQKRRKIKYAHEYTTASKKKFSNVFKTLLRERVKDIRTNFLIMKNNKEMGYDLKPLEVKQNLSWSCL